mgnify:CR=1 FL=1|jgi:hypothetical protein
MANLQELYEVVERMIKEGRGKANIYFSDEKRIFLLKNFVLIKN